jgi:hypothetical protein
MAERTVPIQASTGEFLQDDFTWATPAVGTPTDITVANEAADATCFPMFVTAATGDLGPKSNAGLTFDSTTAILTATGFAGPLTGNVTGDCSGTSATVTGATQAAITTVANVTTVGALNAGSITSGFGSIDNGASAITTTGTITGGVVTADDITLDGKVMTMTGSASDTAVFTAGTNGTLSIVTTDTAAAAA